MNQKYRRASPITVKKKLRHIQYILYKTGPQSPRNWGSAGVLIHLNKTALEHLRKIRTDRELVFPLPVTLFAFHKWFHKLQNLAGIPRDEHFGLHGIRRTTATALWEIAPHAAQLALGVRRVGFVIATPGGFRLAGFFYAPRCCSTVHAENKNTSERSTRVAQALLVNHHQKENLL